MGQEGKATTVYNTFSRETSVSITIYSTPTIVWDLLTQAADYLQWNSTIVSIEGEIKLGAIIKLQSKLDPTRVFKLTIKEWETDKRMVWGDRQGTRIYTITNNHADPDSVTFSMVERIGGLMFPLYAKYIPPFDESFERFASDLKTAAEAR